jgi:hypothetical protein
LTDKAVALSNHCLQVAGLLGVVSQSQPNLANSGVDPLLGIQEDVSAPNSLDDLFSADEPIFVLHKKDQQFHGYLLEPKHSVATPKLVALQIEFQLVRFLEIGGHTGSAFYPQIDRRKSHNPSGKSSLRV